MRREEILRDLLGVQFADHFVVQGPTFDDRGKEKELCDLIIDFPRAGIVIQLKTQDPARTKEGVPRCDTAEAKWARKNAAKAARQCLGARRRAADKSTWFQNPIRGKSAYPARGFSTEHLVVLLDTKLGNVYEVEAAPPNTVIHFFSVLEFLEIASDLETPLDLADFLGARSRWIEGKEQIVGRSLELLDAYHFLGGSIDPALDYSAVGRISAAMKNVENMEVRERWVKARESARRFWPIIQQAGIGKPGSASGYAGDRELSETEARQRFSERYFASVAVHLASLRLAARMATVESLDRISRNVAATSKLAISGARSMVDGTPILFCVSSTTSETRRRDELMSMLNAFAAARSVDCERSLPFVAIGVMLWPDFHKRSADQYSPNQYALLEVRGPFDAEVIERALRVFPAPTEKKVARVGTGYSAGSSFWVPPYLR